MKCWDFIDSKKANWNQCSVANRNAEGEPKWNINFGIVGISKESAWMEMNTNFAFRIAFIQSQTVNIRESLAGIVVHLNLKLNIHWHSYRVKMAPDPLCAVCLIVEHLEFRRKLCTQNNTLNSVDLHAFCSLWMHCLVERSYSKHTKSL